MNNALRVEDIKLFLNDFPETNKLLGESEFTPERIRKAIIFTIDEWNTTPPETNIYNEATFPYKALLLYGTTYFLLLGQGIFKERNHLVAQSGGLVIDDDSQGGFYIKMADYFGNLYKNELIMKKTAENIHAGWETIESEYMSIPIY